MIASRLVIYCDFPVCYGTLEVSTRKIAAALKAAEDLGWTQAHGMHLCGPQDKNPTAYKEPKSIGWHNHAAVIATIPHQPDLEHLGRARYVARCVCGWADDTPNRVFGATRSLALNRWQSLHLRHVVTAEQPKRERGDG